MVRSRSGFGSGDDLDVLEPGPALAGLTDTATGPDRIADLDDDELIGALRAWRRLESWTAAGTLAMVAELARRRPDDRTAPAKPGQFPDQPSEFLTDEIAAALTLTGPAADTCLDLAMDLATRLPGTAHALRAGIIDYLKARIIAEATRILSDQDARRVETRILAEAGQQTSGQLRAALARTILAIDPEAAQRRREQAQRDPRIRRWREDAGTAALAGYGLPPADVLEADQHLTERALDLREAGLPGTMDELRARAYLTPSSAATLPPPRPANPPHPGSPPHPHNPAHRLDPAHRPGPARRPAPAVWSIGWPRAAHGPRADRPVHRRRAAQFHGPSTVRPGPGRDGRRTAARLRAPRPIRAASRRRANPEHPASLRQPLGPGPRRAHHLRRAARGPHQPDCAPGHPARTAQRSGRHRRVRAHRPGPGPRHHRPRRRSSQHQLEPDHHPHRARHRARPHPRPPRPPLPQPPRRPRRPRQPQRPRRPQRPRQQRPRRRRGKQLATRQTARPERPDRQDHLAGPRPL